MFQVALCFNMILIKIFYTILKGNLIKLKISFMFQVFLYS